MVNHKMLKMDISGRLRVWKMPQSRESYVFLAQHGYICALKSKSIDVYIINAATGKCNRAVDSMYFVAAAYIFTLRCSVRYLAAKCCAEPINVSILCCQNGRSAVPSWRNAQILIRGFRGCIARTRTNAKLCQPLAG